MRSEYRIIKPNYWKKNYEIQTNEGVKIGTTVWQGPLSYKAGFTGRTHQWSIRAKGLMNQITVLDKYDIEIGFITRNVWANKIIFHYKGREYRFRHYHWASKIYIWEDMENRKIMSFKGKYYGKNKVGTMRVYGNMDVEFMDLMTNLGWYMVTFTQIQQAGAG